MRQLGSGYHDATADVCQVFNSPAAHIRQGGHGASKGAPGPSAPDDGSAAGCAMELQQSPPTWGSADDHLFPNAHGPTKLPHQVSDLEHHQPHDQGHLTPGLTEDQRCATLRGALSMIVAPHANAQPMRGAASSPGAVAADAAAGPDRPSRPGSPFHLTGHPSRANMELLTISVATLDAELKAQEQEEHGAMDLLGTQRYAVGAGAGLGAGDRLSGGAQRPPVASASGRRVALQALSPLSKTHTWESSARMSSIKGSARAPSGGGMADHGAASPATPSLASSPTANKLVSMIIPPWGRPSGGALAASQVKLDVGQGAISAAAAPVTPVAEEEAWQGGPRVSRIGSVGNLRRVAELEAPAPAAAAGVLAADAPASGAPGSPGLRLLATERPDSRARHNSIRLVLTTGGRPALGGEGQQQQQQSGSGGSPKESSRSGWLMRSTPAAVLWAHSNSSPMKRSGSPGPGRGADEALAPSVASKVAAADAAVGGGVRISGDGGALASGQVLVQVQVPQRMRRVGSYESLVGNGVSETGMEVRAGRASAAGAQPGPGAGAGGALGTRPAVSRKGRAEPVGEGEELVGSLGVAPRAPEAPMLDEVRQEDRTAGYPTRRCRLRAGARSLSEGCWS